MARLHNFNAGPSILPLPVLEAVQRDLVDYRGKGLSVLEMSHRSAEFGEIFEGARAALRRLLSLPDDFDVLLLQGGASLQFAMVPLNLGRGGGFLTTGEWAKRALAEARRTVGDAAELYSDEAECFRRLPGPQMRFDGPRWLHYTSNNTIYGTQFHHVPLTDGLLVCDMSSDFLSRPIDVERFDLIYAGAQKNAGPSGVTLIVGRKALLDSFAGPENTPTMLRYATHRKAGGLYNTPSTFGVWVCRLVFEWIEAQGGLQQIAVRNEEKARLIYDAMDERPELFVGHAQKRDRSLMNVTFRLRTPELEERFLREAEGRGCVGLAGHRSVGGLRASLYNALPVESARVLADLMRSFRA